MSEQNLKNSLVLKATGLLEYEKVNLNQMKENKNIKNNKEKLTSIELYNKILDLPEFKKPETKEKILDEDDYINSLEEIITRDYFPDLYKSNQIKKQVKFLIKIANQ
jgi:hypothetical protein